MIKTLYLSKRVTNNPNLNNVMVGERDGGFVSLVFDWGEHCLGPLFGKEIADEFAKLDFYHTMVIEIEEPKVVKIIQA